MFTRPEWLFIIRRKEESFSMENLSEVSEFSAKIYSPFLSRRSPSTTKLEQEKLAVLN